MTMVAVADNLTRWTPSGRDMRAERGTIEAQCRRIFRARRARVTRYLWYPPRATVELDVVWWRAHWLWLNWRALRHEATGEACRVVSGLVLIEFRVRFVLRGRAHG